MACKKRKITVLLIGLCLLLCTACGVADEETEWKEIPPSDAVEPLASVDTDADIETETDAKAETETESEADVAVDRETDAKMDRIELETIDSALPIFQESLTPLSPIGATLIHSDGSPLAYKSKPVTYYIFSSSSGRDYELEKALSQMTGAATTSNRYVNEDRLNAGAGALPLTRIDSMNDIKVLKSFNSNRQWQALADSYDGSFFETKTLFLVSFSAGSGSYRYSVDKMITVTDDELCFHITHQTPPPVGTCDMRYWYVLFEIERADIEHCTEFNAQMN